MSEDRTQRRLAAILAADVVGYSRLMAADEAGTLSALKARRRDLLAPLVARYLGRIFKVNGDGVLVEFASAVNALECAVELQQDFAAANAGLPDDRQIVLRIGVCLGDVLVEGGDCYGDSVNVAARLEALAEPGGILVSGTAYDHVKGKVKAGFDDLGAQRLKNLAEPARAYRVTALPVAGRPLPRPVTDRPSIAVLPFQNMSGDVEQEYFADGMVEEITTALSRMRWLFVIARNSSFTYKGRAVDVKQVGRELGVRYVLEGSVRRAGNRVRITGQLIDTASGAHLWADRFEGRLEDVFDLQDQVTASVVGAIAPKLEQAEIDRSRRKPTESLDAYDCYLRGMAAVILWTRETNREALDWLYQAIELDPKFALAYGMAARCYSQRKTYGWTADCEEVAETLRLARQAAELGKDDAQALCNAGFALAYVGGKLVEGDALIDKALALNPNLAWAWYYSGWVKAFLGEPEAAIECVGRALRLSPHDPVAFSMHTVTAYAHFHAGRDAQSLLAAELALRERPDHPPAVRIHAAAAAATGQQALAEQAMAKLRQVDPTLRLSTLKDRGPFRSPDFRVRLTDALRLAGLPE